MAETLQLTIVTPERALVEEAVEEVYAPGAAGYLGILPGHAPLFSELGVGELSYSAAGRTHYLAVANGFIEVVNNEVRILADAAEMPSDIDLERARAARLRAEQHMASGAGDVDYDAVQRALTRAEVRIAVAEKRTV